jgi:hypothetical protein
VVSFRRCSIKLSPESIGFILQSFIGGNASAFKISVLSDIVFRISVSCKSVGFSIYNLRSYECNSFKAYFNPWNSGGPNWVKEYKLLIDEEDSLWNLVSRKRRPMNLSYSDAVCSKILTGANLVLILNQRVILRNDYYSSPRISMFNRLSAQEPRKKTLFQNQGFSIEFMKI